MHYPRVVKYISKILAPGMVMAALALSMGAKAETFSITNIQLFTTDQAEMDALNGTGTEDEELTVFRAEHFGGWEYGDVYGDNYFSLDLYHGVDVGGPGAGSFGSDTKHQMFFVYQPRISIPGLTAVANKDSFVKDIYLSYRREQASYGNFYSNNLGFSLDLAVPGTQFFEIDFLARQTNVDDGTEWLSRIVWLAPFEIGDLGAHFDGLALIKSTDAFDTSTLVQADFLIDVAGMQQFQAGIRLEHARYDDPLGGMYERTSPYLMVKLYF